MPLDAARPARQLNARIDACETRRKIAAHRMTFPIATGIAAREVRSVAVKIEKV
jgi:hypothetical protein